MQERATTISSTNYDNEVYVDITSIGSGIHTVGYPDIAITIDGIVSVGNTDVIPSYYNASATPVITGGVDSIFIKNGGNSFGNNELLNYKKNLNTRLLTGKEAVLKPLSTILDKLKQYLFWMEVLNIRLHQK